MLCSDKGHVNAHAKPILREIKRQAFATAGAVALLWLLQKIRNQDFPDQGA